MPRICLVIPCFNEAARLPVQAFAAWLDAAADCAFCFVNDGSTDDTGGVLTRIQANAPGRVAIVTLDRNQGKAEAVRRGVLDALSRGGFDYIGYWDADLATPLREVGPFAETLQRLPACDFVLGSRVKRLGANIERSDVRHVAGRIFATLASLLLDLPVYDSQCGAKLFRATAAAELFAEAFISRWLFDVELLVRLDQAKPIQARGSAIEVPLGEWRDVRGSKLGLTAMAAAPLELLRIRSHYARR